MADYFSYAFLIKTFAFQVEDDDHDSGTESDDEHPDTEEPETSK